MYYRNDRIRAKLKEKENLEQNQKRFNEEMKTEFFVKIMIRIVCHFHLKNNDLSSMESSEIVEFVVKH